MKNTIFIFKSHTHIMCDFYLKIFIIKYHVQVDLKVLLVVSYLLYYRVFERYTSADFQDNRRRAKLRLGSHTTWS